ncbi:MAG: transaldolase [Candidatus Omnitrophota bacterium]
MKKTAIQRLNIFGQSIWLDNINRAMIESGQLEKMIGLGLMGMTSNPTIFDNAIGSSSDYDNEIAKLSKAGRSAFEIYDDLTVRDVQDAADLFLPVHNKSKGMDGYVSLEINPLLSYRTEDTIKEGKRLHEKVDRPNVMLKVPATEQGFAAVEKLIACGININVTLIFSVEQYLNTAVAYIKGLENFLESGGDVSSVRSVASVFVSRVDSVCDKRLEEVIATEENEDFVKECEFLKGRAAVANANLIYKEYQNIISSTRFYRLRQKGGSIQRVLWGSTSTKNPAYSDIKYVEELIGKSTVNTIPDKTFEAVLDHGKVKEALTADDSEAQKIIVGLKKHQIDIKEVCRELLEAGVSSFESSFESLLRTIETKRGRLSSVRQLK